MVDLFPPSSMGGTHLRDQERICPAVACLGAADRRRGMQQNDAGVMIVDGVTKKLVSDV